MTTEAELFAGAGRLQRVSAVEVTEGIPASLATRLTKAGIGLTDCGGVPLPEADAVIGHLSSASRHVVAAHDSVVRALQDLSLVPRDVPAGRFADQEYVRLTAVKNRLSGVDEAMQNRGVTS
jgi:hypothetical protein